MARCGWTVGFTAMLMVAATLMADDAARVEGREEVVADGVYRLTFEPPGRPVTLSGGKDAFLGERVSTSLGVGESLHSISNDNTHLVLKLNQLGPLPPEAANEQTAMVVGGRVFHIGRPSKVPADGLISTRTNVYSADAARVVADHYKLEPQLRKHPGHRYEVRWTPEKARYAVGEPVTLKLEIKNVGTGPIRFTHGGKQRGPRNNQFRFIAQPFWDGKALPDTGDASNFGGWVLSKTLAPGETFTAEVDVTKWFTFTESGTYRITGMLEMPIIDPNKPDDFGPTIWDDLAVGECDVRVVAPKKRQGPLPPRS